MCQFSLIGGSPLILFFFLYLLMTSNGVTAIRSTVSIIWIRTYENVKRLLHAKQQFNFFSDMRVNKSVRCMGRLSFIILGSRTEQGVRKLRLTRGLTSKPGGLARLIEKIL